MQRLLVAERNSRQLQKVGEDILWEKISVVVARKGLWAELFQQNLLNKSVGREETILQTPLINHVEYFSVPNFCGSFWKPWRETPVVDDVLSSHEQEIYPTTSLDENCIFWISNVSELLRWFKADVLGFKFETCQMSWLRNLQSQRCKKGARRRDKVDK